MNNSSLINLQISEAVIGKVSIYIFKTVVPVEDAVTSPDSPEPCYAEIHNILEMSKENDVKGQTYFLPVGTWRGLTSAFLKWANTSSHGAAS